LADDRFDHIEKPHHRLNDRSLEDWHCQFYELCLEASAVVNMANVPCHLCQERKPPDEIYLLDRTNGTSDEEISTHRWANGLYDARPAVRICLRCGQSFPSRGPANRICEGCRVKNEALLNFMGDLGLEP